MGSHECSELPRAYGEIPVPSKAPLGEVGHVKMVSYCVIFELKTLTVAEAISFHFCFILKSKLELIGDLFFFFFLSVGLSRKPV